MHIRTSSWRLRSRALGALVIASVLVLDVASAVVFPSMAQAITAEEILARARTWTDANVSYSQRRSHEGYRTDCSGFVSMAWELDSSYTSRTIGSQAISVPLSELEPGDAVLTPGHVVIFAGWTDDAHTAFVSLEEANGRLGSVERVRDIQSNARGLRYSGLAEAAPEPDEVAQTAPLPNPPEANEALREPLDLLDIPLATRPSYAVGQTVNVPLSE